MYNDSRMLVSDIYQLTAAFPEDERWGLTAQTRRAAISIPSNIAEGAGRDTAPEFARYLRMAIGSVCELEAQLEQSRDLGFISDEELMGEAERIVLIRARLRALKNHFSPRGVR